MACSDARMAANRANARRSTGPTSAEGKAASRANSFRHGMTGAGVVVAAGDGAAADRLAAGLRAELRPGTVLGSVLVERLAVLAVRMERCARQDSAAVARRTRDAAADFEDARADAVDAWFAGLMDTQGTAGPGLWIRKLRRSPEGLIRLIRGWVDLASALRRPGVCAWGAAEVRAFDALGGREAGEFAPSRASVLSRVIAGDDVAGLDGHEAATLAGLDAGGRAEWARGRLLELITAEVDELEADYRDFDRSSIELDRAEAADRALFDPSREADLARKYEAAAERGFFRALREFRLAEAEVEVEVEAPPPASASDAGSGGSLASFFQKGSAPLGRDVPGPLPPRPGQVERTEERPGSVGVARGGGGSGGMG